MDTSPWKKRLYYAFIMARNPLLKINKLFQHDEN